MITLPISNRDLLRSVMARVPAAGVRYADERLQEAIEDQELGMCSFTLVREPEIQVLKTVYNPDGTAREVKTTQQHHHVEIVYQNPELEFLKRLEWGA